MKIGKYVVPNRGMRMGDSLQNALKLYNEYKTNSITKLNSDDGIAKTFGYSGANNGSYTKAIAALKDYGFLEKATASEFKVSNLTINAQFGTKEEKKDALITALNNIPLWKQLYENYKDRVPDDPIWFKIRNITGVMSDEAQKVESFVREAYMEDVTFIREAVGNMAFGRPSIPQEKSEEEETEKVEEKKQAIITRKTLDPTMITVTIGSFQTTLPISEIGFEAAKSFLESLKPHFLPEKQNNDHITI
jgi:hypothetical protein